MSWSFLEAYEKCLAYGGPSQPSLRRMEPKKFSLFLRTLMFVSVNINMFSAIYNIDSDNSILLLCVDFLGTHMTTLVLF